MGDIGGGGVLPQELGKVETAVDGCNSWVSVWILSCCYPVKLSI